MAGLTAKFTKNFNGESEVGYTNFDNPVYELGANGQPNFDAPNVAPARAFTFDSLFGGKGESRKRFIILGVTAAIVILAIIIVAAAVGSTAAKEKQRKADARSATSSSKSTETVNFYGSMSLKDQIYSALYTDPQSVEYKQLKAEFEKTMDQTISEEGMSDKYVGTEVIRFRAGSIVVVYEMRFLGTPARDLNSAIVSNVVRNNGEFGKFVVDVESITLSRGSLPPTTKKITSEETTTKTISTRTTKAPRTRPTKTPRTRPTRTPRIRTTTPSNHQNLTTKAPTTIASCGHSIIPECASVLSYNSSIRPLAEQNRMKAMLLRVANHTSVCYEDSRFYMCSVIAPHCYGTGNVISGGFADEFLLPCRQLCHQYSRQCKEELMSVELDLVFTCELYQPYTPRSHGRCTYNGSPPPVEVITTSIPPNSTHSEVCYPIHHSYCANVPWKAAYLPNYMGHTTLSDAYDFLSFVQALQDSGMHCHDELHTLFCGSLLPKCDSNYHRIPPCRSLCLDVLANCTLMLANLPIHVPISCSIFTDDTNCTNVGGPLPPSGCNTTSQYSCLDGNQCVDLTDRCNGVANCRDGSDEIGCVNTTKCNDGQFKCSITGACLPSEWQCDSYNDCGDSSDEVGCECSEEKFKCAASDNTMRCINGSQQCDGYYNCFGRQDEMNCNNFTCRTDQFQCNNGLCRPLRFVCDGDDDCGDQSDEMNCLVGEQCLVSEFKCLNGSRQWGIGRTSCIPKAWKCDIERDCTDGSDEKNCSSLCFPNPCSHGGNCSADIRGYVCECPAGTGGSNCQIVEQLPEVSCDTEIVIEACKAPLRSFHTTTISTTFSQNQVAPYITAGITKFEDCYEHAAEFLCQYALPQCGSLAFPMFPCRSMCREFKARCAHKLNDTQALDRLIECNSLVDDHRFPDAECFKLTHSEVTVAPPAPHEFGCQELKVEFCKDLGYNTTYLPNFFNQTHQSSAEWLVEQFEYAHSNMPMCNPYLKHFGCAIAAPQCNTTRNGPIPPCKNLCEAVAFDCGYWMDHMQWKFPFTCDSFPQSNDSSVCVQLPPPVSKVGCYGDQFECGSGECVHKTFQCDNFPDCDDGSDEGSDMCENYWSHFSSTTAGSLIDFFSQLG